jgi:hypothetical protein
VCEGLALVIGILFRSLLKPCPENANKRQLVSLVIGLALGFHCFNQEFWHIVFVSFASYLFMIAAPRNISHL